MKKHSHKSLVVFLVLLLSSCATFKSPLEGKYELEPQKNYNSEKVSALFIFSHYHQTIGFDAIPRLDNKYEVIKGFDDFFLDALNEISNISQYSTYTEYSSDVADSERRALKDSMVNQHDFVIKAKFIKEKSFAKFFFGIVASSVSLTVIPIRYKYKYSLEVSVYNSEQKLLKTYYRKSDLNNWVQTFLIFAYPFHPQNRKREELYVEFLHDVFKQIESEKTLSHQ